MLITKLQNSVFCILNTFVLFMLRGRCAFDGKVFLFVMWILHHALITKVHKKQRSNKARGRIIMGWSILLCHIFLQGNADLSTFWKRPLLMTWLLINVSIAFSQSTDIQTFWIKYCKVLATLALIVVCSVCIGAVLLVHIIRTLQYPSRKSFLS